ncbi:hypothetical protein GUITHDRAFT_113584 [Guillardia theta CCMP2712]|uniref:Uncharacterized protein n=1 Tax=Guillardia theta (strain CCMP2712) TaxID=905079 RepID=L1IVS3_GUITC|nr:hypothetical protein GUITHDRAFT_122902 [Guillardia theta CCMP2712]XP_005827328.1 hypothetical protein GUITHDRAFT_113584 [Guillardia theta CCMP2712]EKX30891.1 hypothetical protein GUITHDRAFT_122902 [Guillardia theta CCMP2712]EKX40348.1 hypothetical protein GUITHDRAFT_113584 [Guillardia theta CCMP2712]|eukprot:XP_005817871.1 hypothetical protein GUITHDRAFT_122902 [Guillardia theta CCMP2712]
MQTMVAETMRLNEGSLEDAIASLFPEDAPLKFPVLSPWNAAAQDGDWLVTIPAQFLTSESCNEITLSLSKHANNTESTHETAKEPSTGRMLSKTELIALPTSAGSVGPISSESEHQESNTDGDSASSVSSASPSPDCLLAPPSQDAFVSSPPPPAANGGSRKSKASSSNYQWSREEHRRFVDALEKLSPLRQMLASHGRVTIGLGHGLAEMISKAVGTRSISQVRSHAQKYFQRINRERGYEN